MASSSSDPVGGPSVRKTAYGRTSLFHTDAGVSVRVIKTTSGLRRSHGTRYHKLHKPPMDNVCCWHCCEQLEKKQEVYQAPKHYDSVTGQYFVYGYFCTLSCCKAYISGLPSSDRFNQLNIFHHMSRNVYGVSDSIVPAPERISLRKFGGPMEIRSFREQPKPTALIEPPFVSYCMLLEEQTPTTFISDGRGSRIKTDATEAIVAGTSRAIPKLSYNDDEFAEPPPASMYDRYVADAEPCTKDEPVKRKRTVAKRDAEPVGASASTTRDAGTLRRFKKKVP